jgi:hypothetical protein
MLPTPSEVQRWLQQQNIYQTIDNIEGYAFVFGNLTCGYVLTDKALLQTCWSKAIHMSQSHSYGDVSLYYNGKLIRSMMNGNNRILDKQTLFKYKVTKYESRKHR